MQLTSSKIHGYSHALATSCIFYIYINVVTESLVLGKKAREIPKASKEEINEDKVSLLIQLRQQGGASGHHKFPPTWSEMEPQPKMVCTI